METKKNKNYDLIHADPGITLEWQEREKNLIISGEGTCELGEVRGDIAAEGHADVTVRAVSGNTWSYDDSRITAGSVGGGAATCHTSTITIGGVKI